MEVAMKSATAALLAIITVLPALAVPAWAAFLTPISPHEALSNLGQCVTVKGTASVRPDPQRLGTDVDIDGKDSSFFGYILPGNEKEFPQLQSLNGQQVQITGVVQFYHSRAEVRMTVAQQIAPASAGSSGGPTHIGPEFARSGYAATVCSS
jgi:hypothetical protein